jgi:hypothetical protein
MENVKIEIAGHKKFAKLEFEVKSSWYDLDADDLKAAAEMAFSKLDEQDLALGKLVSRLVMLPSQDFKELGELLMGEDDGVDGMIGIFACADFVRTKRPVFADSLFIDYKNFDGPADGLGNITWYQFGNAEMFYALFMEDRELADLEACLSFLYCKGEFKQNHVHKVLKEVEKWPLNDKQALFHNYMGLRNAVLDVPEIAEPEKDEEELDPLQALKADMASGQHVKDALMLPLKLAGEKFGTVQQINAMLVPDVLELMDQLKEVEK